MLVGEIRSLIWAKARLAERSLSTQPDFPPDSALHYRTYDVSTNAMKWAHHSQDESGVRTTEC